MNNHDDIHTIEAGNVAVWGKLSKAEKPSHNS